MLTENKVGERLNKFLASLGYCSRRKIDILISGGNIVVNGKKAVLGQRVVSSDKILINGKEIVIKPISPIVYLLNKPVGVVSTVDDEFKRKTVTELIKVKQKLYPVGRLDIDTSGLILLTNDGNLAYKLTHPKFGVEKEYEVKLTKPLDATQLAEIKRGVEDGRGSYRIDQISNISKNKYQIILHEGKKREIRRIMSLVGANLVELKRVRIGNLVLGDLNVGESRRLTNDEIATLFGDKVT